MRTHSGLATVSLLLAAVIIPAGPASAQGAAARTSIDLPAQNLESALIQLGRQAGVSLLFDPELARGKRSASVRGRLSPQRALERLLVGTGLSYRRLANGALVVVRGAPARRRPTVRRPSPPADRPQDDAPTDSGLQEIIVTAQKKVESLQRAPISIVVLGQSELRTMRITNVSDIGSGAPNVQSLPHPSGQSSPLIAIRGIGASDNQITQDPSVAVYVDGIYVARAQGMGTEHIDLERIEVLRGPQGTLYGRNATGGAINFVTHKPQVGEWGAEAIATTGNFDAREGRMTVNIPIGARAAARLSYHGERRAGPVRNLGTGAPSFGSRHRDALRADLRWRPSEALDLRYVFDQSRVRDTAFYIQSAPGGAPTTRPTTSEPGVRDFRPNDIMSRGHSLTIDWRVSGALMLRSISAYRDLDHFSYQDYLSGRFGAGVALIGASDIRQRQWSQEVQFLGSGIDDQLDFVAGAYYFAETAHGLSLATSLPQGITQRTISDIRNKAYAVYAQGTWTPIFGGDRLHLTLAGRWSRDERTAEVALHSESSATGTITSSSRGQGYRAYTDISPTLTAAYDLTADTSIYAKISQGYKTGGYNLRSSTIDSFQRGFDPEKVHAYELGFKSEHLGRRLRFNAALFRSVYDDIQLTFVNVVDPTTSDTINAGYAVIQGVELDLTAKPTDALLLGLGFAGLDPAYKRIVDGAGIDVTDGYRFSVPKSSLTVRASYRFPDTAVGSPTLLLSYGWQGGYANANASGGRYDFPSRGLLDARFELTRIPAPGGKGSLQIALWSRNLTDTKYWFINGSPFGGYRGWGEPRTFGMDLGYRF